MARIDQPRTGPGTDGVRVIRTGGARATLGLRIGAATVAALAAVLAVRLLTPPPSAADPQPDAAAQRQVARAEAAGEPAPPPIERREASPQLRAATTDATLSPEAPREGAAPAPSEPTEGPEVPEPDFTLGPPGEKTGIQLFPPPGTKKLERGIVVPPDFTLPEGYVRHIQVTDDGVELPAILMFHPDYDWVDAAGQPIAIPEDRVVPPALAPRGLEVRMLELPGEREPDAEP